jgi:hypothetical protein
VLFAGKKARDTEEMLRASSMAESSPLLLSGTNSSSCEIGHRKTLQVSMIIACCTDQAHYCWSNAGLLRDAR